MMGSPLLVDDHARALAPPVDWKTLLLGVVLVLVELVAATVAFL